jgi:hypothetical protein
MNFALSNNTLAKKINENKKKCVLAAWTNKPSHGIEYSVWRLKAKVLKEWIQTNDAYRDTKQ